MVYLCKDSVFIPGHQSGSATLFPFLEIERGQALDLRNNQALTATDVGREVNSLGAPIACFLGGNYGSGTGMNRTGLPRCA